MKSFIAPKRRWLAARLVALWGYVPKANVAWATTVGRLSFVRPNASVAVASAGRSSAPVLKRSNDRPQRGDHQEVPDHELEAESTERGRTGSRESTSTYVAQGSAESVVFLDPSGRRWRRLRVTAAVLAVLLVAALVLVVPKLADTPALKALGEPLSPALTSAQTGIHVPLVGQGPLVRVLQVRREGNRVTGIDPFTNQTEATFTAKEVRHMSDSAYVIQRFGYSAAAQRTISLTFDDGPDPKWTPELLNLLAKEKVPATFFATGTMIARHPEIFQRETREGHAVANHSLTHTDITAAPSWRARMELTFTDHIIRAVTGKEVGYFRLPYEGSDEASTQATIDGLLRAQRFGYLVTSHDYDTDDWYYTAHPDKGNIPLPTLAGRNVTVLMHDAGGTGRQQTIDYVRKLIPYAKAHGYTFHTMPQVQPWLSERVVDVQPTLVDQAVLMLVRLKVVWPNVLLRVLFVLAVSSVIILGLTNCLLAAVRRRRRNRAWSLTAARDAFVHRGRPVSEQDAERISVVIAAYNEQDVIARTLRSILASKYPLMELLVVNDGSADGTAEAVSDVALTDSRVVLIDQHNTGKAVALNHALQRARGDIIVTLDADTIVTPETIGYLVRHFAADETGRLGAVAGVLRVGNRKRNLLTRWQALEYLTQIGVDRAAQDALGAISIVPGACAAWRKAAILSVGGYTHATLAEDCDLALSLHRAGWRLSQDDDALAYTEAPENVDALLAQRTRWVYGTLQAIYKHRDMLFRRRYGWLGWYVLPNYVLSIVIPLVFLPFMVFMGIQTIQQSGVHVLIIFFLLFLLAHVGLAAVGVALMREKWHHLLMVPIYRIIYEPLRAYLLYTSVYMALRGVRAGWNKLARTGSMDVNLDVSYDSQPNLVGAERTTA